MYTSKVTLIDRTVEGREQLKEKERERERERKRGVSEGERELHLFSPPCSKQKQDDLCGASAASPRCGRILAFSSAPSRVARVAECGIAFTLSVFSTSPWALRCIFLGWRATTDLRSLLCLSLSPALLFFRIQLALTRVDDAYSGERLIIEQRQTFWVMHALNERFVFKEIRWRIRHEPAYPCCTRDERWKIILVLFS